MKEQQSIESVFKQALEHAEMPVDPVIWQGVSAGMGAVGSAGAVGGLSVLTKVVIGIAAAAGITAATWIGVSSGTEDSTQPAQEFVQETPVVSDESQAAPVPLEEPSSTDKTKPETAHTPLPKEERPQQDAATAQREPTNQNLADNGSGTGSSFTGTEGSDINAGAPAGSIQPSAPKTLEDAEPGQGQGNTAPDLDTPPEAAPTPDPLLSAVFDSLRMDPMVPRYLLEAAYQNAESYHWFADGEAIGEGRQLGHLFENDGPIEVQLRVSDLSGKTRTYEMVFDLVHITPSVVVVPEIFTPSSPGSNDHLDLEALSTNCTLLRLWVFDFTGKPIFESTEANPTWDGLDPNGNLCAGDYLVRYVMLGTDGVLHRGEQQVRVN